MKEENENTIKKSERALKEEAVLSFWKENNIFQKTLEKESTKGEFVFYDGPPTANGKPGIHHLEPRAFKDAIPRYKTMKGYHVRRKGGWDTHGLPVELQVEKELQLTSKKDIEKYGVSLFNQKCKESVWKYIDEWESFTDRSGYWIDHKNPYVTYHNSYIESLWNIVAEVQKKGLLYKDYKVLPWCPRCGTALSSHELAQGYEDVKDLSVYAKFKVVPGQKISGNVIDDNTYIIAWTTTPWTLPGNVGLAVGKNIKYAYVLDKSKNEKYIVAFDLCTKLFPVEGESVMFGDTVLGSDLVGLSYEPLYPYLKDNLPDSEKQKLNKAFKVHEADFVTTTDGTGIVHTAVMYGQDDFVLGTEVGLPKFHLVKEDGTFIDSCDFLSGRFVKDEDVAVDIIKDLAHRGLLFKKEKYEHSYPHCWRCKTALIYYARDSWYIKMSEVKSALIEENKTINWEPAYIRDGRFGEWLKDLKDWAISRERYWGTPLPIWERIDGSYLVISSTDDIKKYAKKSGNTYYTMRHGFTQSNGQKVWSCDPVYPDHVTEEGRTFIALQSETLKDKKIDFIYVSPFVRTKETAKIIQNALGLSDEQVIVDDRLGEWQVGKQYHGKPIQDFLDWRKSQKESSYTVRIEGGESYREVVRRSGDCLYDLEKKYQNKNILIISHGSPLRAIELVASGLTVENQHTQISNFNNYQNGEIRKVNFSLLPHNEYFELDLHRPYIDEIELIEKSNQPLKRVKEVMDVWFDSGAMPFAQDGYPKYTDTPIFPADFIAEGIDQTRGWFYTLHAVGVLMGRGKAYKNVICLGHILDKNGKKMSKSVGNVVDPWEMMHTYGADPLRFWMYTVNQPGEPKNFDEKTVTEVSRKVFTLLENVVLFYELFRNRELEKEIYQKEPNSTAILDQWILVKLNQLIEVVEKNLDNYKLLEGGRAIRSFIDDLSTWYVRRSREELKEGNSASLSTLYYVLKTLSKIMAPFAPFMSEEIYQKLRGEEDKESVHLEDWPTKSILQDNDFVISEMEKVRLIVTLGLEARQKANIKVRQPLEVLYVKNYALSEVYRDIICDELNIKNLIHDKAIENEVILDVTITPKLKAEGDIREFIRAVQDMRKTKGLQASQTIVLTVDTDEVGKGLLTQFKSDLSKTVGAKEIVFSKNNGEKIIVDELEFIVSF